MKLDHAMYEPCKYRMYGKLPEGVRSRSINLCIYEYNGFKAGHDSECESNSYVDSVDNLNKLYLVLIIGI